MDILLYKFIMQIYCVNSIVQCPFIDIGLVCQNGRQSEVFYNTISDMLT